MLCYRRLIYIMSSYNLARLCLGSSVFLMPIMHKICQKRLRQAGLTHLFCTVYIFLRSFRTKKAKTTFLFVQFK